MLETERLSKYFGGLAAVNDLNMTVNQGEILGLIGPNGAGKTSFYMAIYSTLIIRFEKLKKCPYQVIMLL